MEKMNEVMAGLTLELRRGTIILSVLSQLNEPKYGYSLVQSLEEKNVILDPSTLYPLLRRLEKQGILKSEWETTGTKPRKYYILTDFGKEVYEKLCGQWLEMVASMDRLMNGGNANG